MLLSDSEEYHPEQEDNQKESNPFTRESSPIRPERKLLMGTVQFFEDILESLNDIYIAVITLSGKHVTAWGNDNLSKVFGFRPSELKGTTIEEIFEEDTVQLLFSKINQACETGERVSFIFETRLVTGFCWIHALFTPLSETKGSGRSVVGCFRNITHQVEQEDKIRELEQGLAGSIEKQNEGIISTNNKGIVTSVNQILTDMTGYDENKLLGFKLTHLPFIHKQSAHYFQALLDKADKRDIPPFELEWQTAIGVTRWSQVRIRVLPAYERFSGFRISLTDITERKLIEKELLKSKQAYKVIIENAGEAIFIVQDEKVVFSNSKLADLLNMGIGEPMMQDFSGFVHPEDLAAYRGFLKDEKSILVNTIAFPVRISASGTNHKWVECKKINIDWNDKPAYLLYAKDVTEFMAAGDKEKKALAHYRFISEKIWDFIELEDGTDTFGFIGEKLREVPGVAAVLLISYNEMENYAVLEKLSGSDESVSNLSEIIRTGIPGFLKQISHEQFKNLAFGRLIKYNDGLFERGSSIFPGNTLNLIQKTLEVEGVYLIGLKHDSRVYGNAMIFLKEGKKLTDPRIIETLARLSAAALHRKNEWEKIRAGEKKFRHIFESYQDIYFRAEPDGIISEISPSVKNIGGYDPKEIEGKHIRHFFSDRLMIYAYSRILLKEGRLEDKDIALKKKSGEKLHASLNARLILSEKGKAAGWEGFIRDISERRVIEEQFRQSEEKFRTLADFTYGWEYWTSTEGKLIYMSPSCNRISGYDRTEFFANPKLLEEITHPDDAERFHNHVSIEVKANKKGVLKLNYRIVTKTNEVRWINHICQEVYNEDGKSLGRRISNRDITERKIAEDNLRRSEERFRTLFYESPDAIFVESYDGIILDVNPAACRLQGMTKEELVGKNILNLLVAEDKKEVAAEFPKWITGELTNYKGKLKTADKKFIPVEIHGSKIHFSGEGALLFIVRDITESVEKEEWLRKSVERAEQADKLKSAFLANVSHEIRTPMNAIIGFSEILTNPDLTTEEREVFINYITQGGNTLMNLIEDIIDITKIEAGQIKINFSDCNVDSILDELYATFLKIKNKSGKTGIELRLNKPALEKSIIMFTDPYRLRQILSNLLGNAIKFTKSGSVEFGFQLKMSGNIEFYVKDTGIGIPVDKQLLIFERFGQVNDNNHEFKGTGLGLSISKKLAELLGGDLRVESLEKSGSTFYLILPVSKQEVMKPASERKAVEPVTDWSNKTFLIAEDSILNYTFLEAMFQRTKVKLLWAKNGREAVDMCRENQEIDLVLMDIKMPVMTGLEAIAEIKKFRPELPIIVQTAYAMPEDRENSFAAGADEHLTKPLNVKDLFGAVGKFLG